MTLDEIRARARARRTAAEWREEPLEPLPLDTVAAPGSGVFIPSTRWERFVDRIAALRFWRRKK